MLIRGRLYQGGISIVELMIGMAVGLIVVGMVLSVYLTTLSTSGDTLKASRLNQEVSAIMNIMVNDIRRAGYANAEPSTGDYDWDDPAGTDVDDLDNFQEPSTNPFNQLGFSALEVHDNMTSDLDVGSQGSGSCILYAYDASVGDANAGDSNGDGVRIREDNEYFGFRLNGTQLQIRQSVDIAGGEAPNSCGSGSWATLNDERSIEITALNFDLGDSSCINTSEPDEVDNDSDGYPPVPLPAGMTTGDILKEMDEVDCYTTVPGVGSGVNTVERRDVRITLSARLVDDTEVQIKNMEQRVSVRNDLVRVR